MRTTDRLYQTVFTTACAAAALFLVSGSAAAQSAEGNLAVSATVAKNCTIATTALLFGDYDPIAPAPLDREGAILLTCTKGTVPSVTLGDGENGTRKMKSGASDLLGYQLYQEAGRSNVWNAGVSFGAAADNVEHSFPVYGRITALQNVPSGTYQDTVVATVNF